MGTTESLMYDDSQPSAAGGEDIPPKASERESSSRSQHATSQQAPSSPMSSANSNPKALRRAGPRPRKDAPVVRQRPLKRIHGLVLGGPKAGKRTLMQRLQGKDPYAPSSTINKTQAIPDSVTIPFKPTQGSVAWDRIQLSVRRTRIIEAKADFMVVLIRPSPDLDDTQAYILNLLKTHIAFLSHKDKSETKSQPHSVPPVCVMILVNFRDSPGPHDATLSAVNKCMKEFFASTSIPEHRRVCFVTPTSLRNCYGLDQLHEFIYQTYLKRKQFALEEQLQEISTQISRTSSRNMESPSYDDFLSVLESQAKPEQSRNASHGTQARATSPLATKTPRKAESTSKKTAATLSSASTMEIPVGASAPSAASQVRLPCEATNARQKHSSSKHKPALSGKKGDLESFFASDSEEEDSPSPLPASRSTRQNTDHPESDTDSDEDDFFFDERGQFHNAVDSMSDTDSSTEPSLQKELKATSDSPGDTELQEKSQTCTGTNVVATESQGFVAQDASSELGQISGQFENKSVPGEAQTTTDKSSDSDTSCSPVASKAKEPEHEQDCEKAPPMSKSEITVNVKEDGNIPLTASEQDSPIEAEDGGQDADMNGRDADERPRARLPSSEVDSVEEGLPSRVTSAPTVRSSTSKKVEYGSDEDSDDDEFFVESGASSKATPYTLTPRLSQQLEESTSTADDKVPTPSDAEDRRPSVEVDSAADSAGNKATGISADAMAAVQRAQAHAEAMLMQHQERDKAQLKDMKKEKKKKKDKKAKKEDKKKKKKKVIDTTDVDQY